MKISEKINMDKPGLLNNGPINIVAFGDSITHGAFNGYNDYEAVYWNIFKQKLNKFRDAVPVNVINAGIGGASASSSLYRIDRDVLSHHPDLVIVCFGLNDISEELSQYISSLKTIFAKCIETGAEVIFMTPNMLNTYVADDTPKKWLNYAAQTMVWQNEGRMDKYISEAIRLAEEMGVTVCDCYKEWKALYSKGTDTTLLLSNRINHPTEEMHKLFADMLFDIIIPEKDFKVAESINTMLE